MRYYDLQANWRKIKPLIAEREVQAILVRDFNKFTYGRWRQKFRTGDLPTKFESCDWRCDRQLPGRQPAFWDYAKHAACHWLVNFNLELARRAEPKRQWRILTSPLHSTVWDGKSLLFDFNFSAMGIAPKECFKLANKEELKIGEHLVLHFAEHWRSESGR